METLYDWSTLTPIASRSSSELSRIPRALTPVAASLYETSGPEIVDRLPKVLGPVAEPSSGSALKDREPTKLERLKVTLCEVVALAAQSVERGNSKATVAIAKGPASGKVSRRANPRPAKIAFQVSGVRSKKVGWLTGNNHSAATPDHQSVKHFQVCPSHLLAGPNCPAQLPHEQPSEPPD